MDRATVTDDIFRTFTLLYRATSVINKTNLTKSFTSTILSETEKGGGRVYV